MKHFIIAAGGTGAMCVRSFIHLCAAGCANANDSYHILLIDKDDDSDARSQCSNLFDAYINFRSQTANTPTAALRLPRLSFLELDYSQFIRNRYAEENRGAEAELRDLTLRSILRPDAHTERLLRSLYTEEELELDLSKGLYGRPNIGSAIFAYVEEALCAESFRDKNNNEQPNSFVKELKGAMKDRPRVYLFGSLFGGTGASIIPNLVHLLQRKSKGQVILGGAMVLPYFKLPATPESENRKIHPADTMFEEQAREALLYYHESRLPQEMESLFLVGSAEPDVTCERYASSGAQKQHYHMVPQLAAVAALRFFENRLGSMATRDYSVGAEKSEPLGEYLMWKVRPKDNKDENGENVGHLTLTPEELGLTDIYGKLNQFLRFTALCSVYLTSILLSEDKNTMERKLATREVQITYRTMPGYREGMTIAKEEWEDWYAKPMKSAKTLCTEFMKYYYDVALSGVDWSSFESVGKDAGKRWVDVVNLELLDKLVKAANPEDLKKISLNALFTYPLLGRIGGGERVNDFEGNLADIYQKRVLPSFQKHERKVWDLFRGEPDYRTDVKFSELYDKMYACCGEGAKE